MPKQRMRHLAEALQTIHTVANELVTGHHPKYNQLKVVAFETIEDFVAEFQSDQFIGFMQPAMRQHVLAFGLADTSVHRYRVAFHEYTHFVSRSRYENFVPLWYEEGFAQYIGDATISGNHVILGDIRPRRFIRALRKNDHKWVTILDGVPRLDWHDEDYEDHYEFAHAIVHFLYHGVREDGTQMQSLVPQILHTMGEDQRPSTIIPHFAGVSKEQFIETVIAHLRSNPSAIRYPVDKSRFSEIQPIRCMTDLETRQLLSGVLARKNPERAFEHIRMGFKIAPNDPELNVILSYMPDFDNLSSQQRIQKALDLDGKHTNANIRMGDLYSYNCLDIVSEECDQLRELATQHYRIALHNDPKRVDAAFGLGVSLLRTHRAGDSLNYLKVAYQRLPWNARINLFLGEAYLQIGDQDNALQHLQKASIWETEEAIRQRAVNLLQLQTSEPSIDS